MPYPNPGGTRERGYDAAGYLHPSDVLVDMVREEFGNNLLISFSGRDSLAAWLFLRDHGFTLTPYWMYTVPHLGYEQDMLEYYEDYFGQHIMRLPHPDLYTLLHRGAWQAPDTEGMLAAARLAKYTFADVENCLARQMGWGEHYLSVVGMRAADNLMRLRMIRQMGTIGRKRRRFYYAVWDWKTADVERCIVGHGVKLSRTYKWWGSTGVGVEYNWLAYLRDHLPEELERVRALFPLVDLELFRYEGVQ